ncbi:MAG: hypothetical protein OEZ44_04860 [Candidatus Bathyarchaeota archaeon]|nr:hypothetical protein [Candidatus Bathyarchaeota archaeon]
MGSLRFGENLSYTPHRDPYINLIRWYDVEVGPPGRLPASLELMRGNETVWRGKTDEEGRAIFSLTFVDYFKIVQPYVPGQPSVIDVYNMTETLTLTATTPHSYGETKVGLLTDTPIRLTLTLSPSENQIQTFTLVALAVIVAATIFILATLARRALLYRTHQNFSLRNKLGFIDVPRITEGNPDFF